MTVLSFADEDTLFGSARLRQKPPCCYDEPKRRQAWHVTDAIGRMLLRWTSA
jgi:hypothetical protein